MSKTRIALNVILALIVLWLIMAPNFSQNSDDAPTSRSADQSMAGEQGRDAVLVSYLYRGVRCASCVRLEKFTREAVEERFADDMARGRVVFRVVNAGRKENKHFTQTYKIYTQAVIVSDVVNGKEVRWKNLQNVWRLLYNEKAFKAYVQTEVAAYVEERGSLQK